MYRNYGKKKYSLNWRINNGEKMIDVSCSQGRIDWNTVKNHIDGAILRCGYEDNISSQDDAQWLRNVSE